MMRVFFPQWRNPVVAARIWYNGDIGLMKRLCGGCSVAEIACLERNAKNESADAEWLMEQRRLDEDRP